MAATPTNWNINLLGAWNLAILTPDGVRTRLFELDPSTPLELQIAFDQPGTFRIAHDGITVLPQSGKLEISPQICETEELTKAARLAKKALESLPETPLAAAGVNIRFLLEDAPDSFIDRIYSPIDEVYSDAGYNIESSLIRRALSREPGCINVAVRTDREDVYMAEFNFHLSSDSVDQLGEWLEKTGEFVNEANTILEQLLN